MIAAPSIGRQSVGDSVHASGPAARSVRPIVVRTNGADPLLVHARWTWRSPGAVGSQVHALDVLPVPLPAERLAEVPRELLASGLVQQVERGESAELLLAVALLQAAEVRATTTEELPRTEPFSLLTPEDRARLPADVEDAYPLARIQAGMLYHMELAPTSNIYHNTDSFHLRLRAPLASVMVLPPLWQ